MSVPFLFSPPYVFLALCSPYILHSNMNYSLSVSNSVSRIMEEDGVTDSALALSMVQEAAEGEFMAGGDVNMGDIILLVDSDTR